MLANGGALDGVRLLSAERVAQFNTPRPNADEPDIIIFGQSLPLGEAGYWLGQENPPTSAAAIPARSVIPARAIARALLISRPAWPSPGATTACTILTRDDDPSTRVADIIRRRLGLVSYR